MAPFLKKKEKRKALWKQVDCVHPRRRPFSTLNVGDHEELFLLRLGFPLIAATLVNDGDCVMYLCMLARCTA